MRLFTSFWANRELADVDATLVSVSRGAPRWSLPFTYRRLPAFAPGDRAWREADKERFEAAYVTQLEELGAERILTDLERLAAGKAAVLLCWERLDAPGEWCHRRLL